MSVFVIVAAYNEEEVLPSVLAKLKVQGYDNLVVIDDGSTDKTAEIARENAYLVRHSKNKGQGAALRSGIQFCLEHNAEYIVTFDGDDQHMAQDICKLLHPLIHDEADIALGSRFLNGMDEVPFFRKLLLKSGALLHLILYGIKLSDSHNGLRALNRYAASQIEITQDRMEHASEFIEQIRKKKIRWKEIPVQIKYTEYSLSHGQSSWNAIKISLKIIWKRVFG